MANKKQIPLRISDKLFQDIKSWAEDDFRQRRKNGKYVGEEIDKPLDIDIE